MKQRQVVFGFLLPADQEPSIAIHPTVRALDDPAARLEASLSFDQLRFFASASDVCGVSELVHEFPHLVVGVPVVQAEILRMVGFGLGPIHRDAIKRRLNEPHVVAVGPINRQADRDAASFGQEATLDASFGAIRRIGARFSPLPAEPSPWLRPSTANSTGSP